MNQLTTRHDQRRIYSGGATLRAATVDEATFSVEVVLATGDPVPMRTFMGLPIDEVLLPSGGEFPETMPLLACHSRDSLDDVLGSVRAACLVGDEWIGRIYFASSDDAALSAWEKVRDGHLTDVSIGYQVIDFVELHAGETRTVEGETYTAGDVPLRVSTRWTAKEASLVPIGADPRAKAREDAIPVSTRSEGAGLQIISGFGNPKNISDAALAGGILLRAGFDPAPALKRMGFQNWKQIAERSQQYEQDRLAMICEAIVRRSIGNGLIGNRSDIVARAAATGSLQNVLNLTVNAILLDSYQEAGDSTVDWCSEKDLKDYKRTDLAAMDVDAEPQQLAPGGTAASTEIEASKDQTNLYAFARQWSFDEMSIIDDELEALLSIPNEAAAAARRLRPDFVYSILLKNGNMADGGALFNSTAVTTAGGHANYGASATETLGGPLSAATLQAAIATLDAQTDSIGRPIRPGRKYLIVPPALEVTARVLTRSLQIEGDDENQKIILRVESRIGATGVTHPIKDSVTHQREHLVGTATNWFLATEGRSIGCFYRLGTGRVPVVRSGQLTQGTFGMWWDLKHDFAAQALDFRGMIKCKGAA